MWNAIVSSRFVRWVSRHKDRIGIIAAGYSGKQVEELLFDWLLYGAVITWATTTYGAVWGSLVGFLIMTPLSAFVCFWYIRFYDWTKQDWFGFELVKSERDAEGNRRGWIERLVHRIAQWGDIPAFIVLSVQGDPFLTTVYLRSGSDQYNGLSRRDWMIFFGSVLLSNGYWTLRWTVIIEVIRYLIAFIASLF